MVFKDPTISGSSKYTPGPWKVNNEDTGMNDSGTILDPVGHVIVTDIYGRNDAEALANARLIAATPDLLKAVELVLALHDHPESQVCLRAINGESDVVCPIRLDLMAEKQLREAVAKAKGEI